MTVNIVLMRLRKKPVASASFDAIAGLEEDSNDPPKQFGGPDLRLNGVVDRIALQAAINELAPGYRAMFILHHVQGYSHNEIAEMLGCSAGNSKSQLHKARMRLRELLPKALGNGTQHSKLIAGSPVMDRLKFTFHCANA